MKIKSFKHYSLTRLYDYIEKQNLKINHALVSSQELPNGRRMFVAQSYLSNGQFAFGAAESMHMANDAADRLLAEKLQIMPNVYQSIETTAEDPNSYKHYSLTDLFEYIQAQGLEISHDILMNLPSPNGERFVVVQATLSNGEFAIGSADSRRKATIVAHRNLAMQLGIPPRYYLGTDSSSFQSNSETKRSEPMIQTNLNQIAAHIEQTVGYRFQNHGLMLQAFTRSSYRNEHPDCPDNEILELIGDSVLSLTVLSCEIGKYAEVTDRGLITDWNESKLSSVKHSLVNKQALANRMRELGLQSHLLLSRGDVGTDITREDSVLEDLFESLIGAIYLDAHCDFSVATEAVKKMLDIQNVLPASNQKIHISYRNDLQEWCQAPKRHLGMPTYRDALQADGSFQSTVFIAELGLSAIGEGKNMKTSRENAAKEMLAIIEREIPEVPAPLHTVSPDDCNYVGKLQELLQSKGIPAAAVTYSDVADTVLPDNTHLFTVGCDLFGNHTEGEGASKKEAKRNAAKAMLEKTET